MPVARGLLCSAMVFACAAGCTRISVNPDCPSEIAVGDIVDLRANAVNEGGIPTFEWTVIPAAAGQFSTPERQDTDFTATQAGPATIRLFASDGLYTSTAECQVQIGAGGLIVQFAFSPASPETGDEITLTCESIGGIAADELIIEQESGPEVTLTPGNEEGVATFTPSESGQYAFTCVGVDGEEESDPETVEFTVRGGRPRR